MRAIIIITLAVLVLSPTSVFARGSIGLLGQATSSAGEAGAKVAASTATGREVQDAAVHAVVTQTSEGLIVKAAGGLFAEMGEGAVRRSLIKLLPGVAGEIIGTIAVYLTDPNARSQSLGDYVSANAGAISRAVLLGALGAISPIPCGSIILPVIGEMRYQWFRRRQEEKRFYLGENPSDALERHWDRYKRYRRSHPGNDLKFPVWCARTGKEEYVSQIEGNMARRNMEIMQAQIAEQARRQERQRREENLSLIHNVVKEHYNEGQIKRERAIHCKQALNQIAKEDPETLQSFFQMPKAARANALNNAYCSYSQGRRFGHSRSELARAITNHINGVKVR